MRVSFRVGGEVKVGVEVGAVGRARMGSAPSSRWSVRVRVRVRVRLGERILLEMVGEGEGEGEGEVR